MFLFLIDVTKVRKFHKLRKGVFWDLLKKLKMGKTQKSGIKLKGNGIIDSVAMKKALESVPFVEKTYPKKGIKKMKKV